MDDHSELRRKLNALIDALIAEGHYQAGHDVIDAIAQLLDERDKRIAALIDEGEASGFAEPFDFEEFLVEMRNSKDEKSAAE
jgi:Arc/MetJ-type ribon-helix-helix transcriptional regulator